MQTLEKEKQTTGPDEISQLLGASPAPQAATAVAVRNELGIIDPDDLKKKVGAGKFDAALEREATAYVDRLLAVDLQNPEERSNRQSSVEAFGEKVVQRAAKSNELLNQPLKRLGQLGGEGQEIAKTLTDLKVQFDDIDPTRFDFEPGWIGRTLAVLPMVGKPINRYFSKFESAGKIIDALFDSLEVSRQQLLRDIDTLKDDQVQMRKTTLQLQAVIAIAHIVDAKLQAKVDELPDGEDKTFIQAELIFPLRQRITDLQQQMIVNQQGVVMFEVLVRNNKELIRGVNRCKTVTYPALRIGVMAAQSLANQKIVIGKIEALNETTEKFLMFNAETLATQGVEIQKRAASAQLSDGKLAQAMKLVIGALNDVEAFKINAIAAMRTAIDDRERDIAEAEDAILRLEKGNKARPLQLLEVNIDTLTSGERSMVKK